MVPDDGQELNRLDAEVSTNGSPVSGQHIVDEDAMQVSANVKHLVAPLPIFAAGKGRFLWRSEAEVATIVEHFPEGPVAASTFVGEIRVPTIVTASDVLGEAPSAGSVCLSCSRLGHAVPFTPAETPGALSFQKGPASAKMQFGHRDVGVEEVPDDVCELEEHYGRRVRTDAVPAKHTKEV